VYSFNKKNNKKEQGRGLAVAVPLPRNIVRDSNIIVKALCIG